MVTRHLEDLYDQAERAIMPFLLFYCSAAELVAFSEPYTKNRLVFNQLATAKKSSIGNIGSYIGDLYTNEARRYLQLCMKKKDIDENENNTLVCIMPISRTDVVF